MKTTVVMALAATLPALVGAKSANAADVRGHYGRIDREDDARDAVKIGYLDCMIGGGVGYVLGSAKSVDCMFRATSGRRYTERYVGEIRRVGVDLGFTTQGRLLWAVFAPTAGYHRGSLRGAYQGATAEASIVGGVGTNVLVGGTAGSINLQPVSVTGQIGLNLAATGTSMTLAEVR